MAKGLDDIVALPDPVGVTIEEWQRPNGLSISRVRVPIGIIGVIYEDEDGYRLTLGVSAVPAAGGPEIEVVTLEGLMAGYWHDGTLTYALVGPTSEQQLVALATRLGANQPRGWL